MAQCYECRGAFQHQYCYLTLFSLCLFAYYLKTNTQKEGMEEGRKEKKNGGRDRGMICPHSP